ncbi:hypothetical protein HG536_0A01440 [Torulaspora globosa]|uniref:DNA damage checkpoint protein 1 n=1 Tax=Torulaspora globosa TaxID=48254 RepID=A0A7G3Z9Z1_9SACH|nr:uncharacterized protein HG536_0A01440 [Torulaspora globosa]QLL30327.1 hypothetical protein HG536_0A01440 [Torulaspora globosa]
MSFKATISDPERHQIWSRTVNALSTIYEDVRLTITPSELIVWNINSTDTTLSKVRFSSQFFEEYTFQPREIIFGESGIQVVTDSHGVDHKLYSLQINGRHLSTVSKKPDGDAIKNFTISINNSPTCPDILTNRLLVHVEMESLIRKEYTPQFQPIEYDPIIIDLKYKRNFLNVYGSASSLPNGEMEHLDPKLQAIFNDSRKELSEALFSDDPKADSKRDNKLTAADEINFICCNQALLKNFIDNCNANVTEEFKLEINVHKLVMTAFTKAIYGKNNDILKNTMSLSNTISVADLEHYCLFTTVDEGESSSADGKKDQTKSIIFKLKDLKNFLSTTWSWKTAHNDNLNIWFCHSGDPILIELKKNGVTLQLVQVTDGSGAHFDHEDHMAGTVIKKAISPEKSKIHVTHGDTSDPRRSPLRSHQRYTTETRTSPLNDRPTSTAAHAPRRLFVTGDSQPASQRRGSGSRLDWNDQDRLSREPTEFAPEPTNTAPVRAERTGTTIEWGKRPREEDEDFSTLDRQSVLKNEKIKHFQAITKMQEAEGLGPTQQTKPKGLFD